MTRHCETCTCPEHTPTLPKGRGLGAVEWQHRVVCWQLVDEWTEVTREGAAGGVLRMAVRTGGKIVEARFLGSETLIDITPELRALIEADMNKGSNP